MARAASRVCDESRVVHNAGAKPATCRRPDARGVVRGPVLTGVRMSRKDVVAAEVARIMAEDPSVTSERKALRRMDPEETQLRTNQRYMTVDRKDRMREVARVHAAAFPVTWVDNGTIAVLRVAVPVVGGTATHVVEVDRVRRGVTCETVGHDGALARGGPYGPLAALGLSSPADVARHVPPPALAALVVSLVRSWEDAGLRLKGGLVPYALRYETRRLAPGLGNVAAVVDPDLPRLVAAYGDMPGANLGTVLVPGLDPARRALMHRLAGLPHPGVAALSRVEAATWMGRPFDCLAAVHGARERDGVAGRTMSARDAGWLNDTFGRTAEPVPFRLWPALVAFRGSVDPSRIRSEADAGALAALVGAMVDVSAAGIPGDGAFMPDLLAARLAAGGCAGEPYSRVVDSLMEGAGASVGPGALDLGAARATGLARAVAAWTAGVERIRERVAIELLVPAMAADHVARGGDAPTLVAALADGPGPAATVDAHALDLVCSGRNPGDLVEAALSHAESETQSGTLRRYDVSPTTLAEVARHWCAEPSAASRVERAWARLSPLLAPAWRLGGMDLYADRVRHALPPATGVAPSGGRAAPRQSRVGWLPTARPARA